jgi:PAS domain S-box-containing protein
MRFEREQPSPGLVDERLLAAPLLELFDDAVIVTDAEGTPVLLNERARRLTGAPQSDEVWRTCSRSGSAGDLPLARVLRGEQVSDVELDCRDAAGTPRTLRVSGRPLRQGHGAPHGAIIAFRDVTEPDLPAATPPPQALERLPAAVSTVRAADGILLWVSESWQELFGYTCDEAVGRHTSLVVAPIEHTPQERARAMAAALEEEGRWHGEVECVHRDGTHLWTAVEVARFDDPHHGETWICVQTDVSSARAEQAALATSVIRWRSAFDDSPIGMALVGPDLRMTDVNARFCTLAGYSPSELVDTSLATFLHPDDVASEAELAADLRAGRVGSYRIDVRLVRRDGAVVPVTASFTLVRDADGRVLHEIAVLHEA